jgi:hypothetical protein
MKKKFDAVAMTRKIRDKMWQRYKRHPELEIEDLKKTREKYGFPEAVTSVRVAEKRKKYG